MSETQKFLSWELFAGMAAKNLSMQRHCFHSSNLLFGAAIAVVVSDRIVIVRGIFEFLTLLV